MAHTMTYIRAPIYLVQAGPSLCPQPATPIRGVMLPCLGDLIHVPVLVSTETLSSVGDIHDEANALQLCEEQERLPTNGKLATPTGGLGFGHVVTFAHAGRDRLLAKVTVSDQCGGRNAPQLMEKGSVTL